MSAPVLRALVVEDDPSWQQILTEILSDASLAVSDASLTVSAASSLAEALALLKQEAFRVAVVDLSLSGRDHRNEDGLKILEAVRRLQPGCRSILLTGYATVELAVSVLTEYEAFTFLRKENFQRQHFLEIIQRALASPPTLSEGPTGQQPADRSEEGLAPALVVEDDAGWRNILSELLVDAGYEARLCSSFGEALGCMRRENFSLAVMDLSLTGAPSASLREAASTGVQWEGIQLLASAKEAHLPTIVVSGVASPEDIRLVYAEQDIFAFLEKRTFDRTAFLRTVREAWLSSTGMPGVLSALTGRERDVLALLKQGLTNKEISEKLVISNNTVKRHLKAIFGKLEVHSRAAAVSKMKR